MDTFARNQPVLFAIGLTSAWFFLLLAFTGAASAILRRPYGDAVTGTVGRLAVTVCVLILVIQLGWLNSSGIAHTGRWQIWLLALGGLAYLACASLYAFYGKVAFDFSSLVRLPDARSTALTLFVVSLCEEILFRGVMLYALARVWGNTPLGLLASLGLMSLLFAVLHLMQVFTQGLPPQAAVYLVLQTILISAWWGMLVLMGGSIWPAVLLHFAVNALVAVQGLSTPMVKPEALAYERLFLLTIPLGLLPLWMILQVKPAGFESKSL